MVARRACWLPPRPVSLAHRHDAWETESLYSLSLKTDQNLLGFEERFASRELKKSVRQAEIIFLTDLSS